MFTVFKQDFLHFTLDDKKGKMKKIIIMSN
jgi:hypothetical protein